MKQTLKIASILLHYPSQELCQEAKALEAVLREEAALSEGALASLAPLFERLARDDLYDLQELYVLLFDRSRSNALNLFEHVHGESRTRGSAMVDLLETYRAAGMDFNSAELPDYLPAFLEFLSLKDAMEARAYLREIAHILYVLEERLARRQSDYAPVFRAIAELAGIEDDQALRAEIQSEPDDDPNDLTALDAVWQEAEVTFGPNPEAGCPASRDMLARMAVPKDEPLNFAPTQAHNPTQRSQR